MAGYDVCANPGNGAANGMPCVLVVQSDLLDAVATRLPMPLVEFNAAAKVPNALCPVIVVKGQRFHALVHYAEPLPVKALRQAVDNVAVQADALVSAVDAVLSGIWILGIPLTALRQRDRDGHRRALSACPGRCISLPRYALSPVAVASRRHAACRSAQALAPKARKVRTLFS